MTTVNLSGFVHTRVCEFTGKREYAFTAWDEWASCGYVLVGPHQFDYELPAEFNPIAAVVAQLKAAKEAATAEFAKTVAKINERLAKLEALEFTS